MLARTFPCYMAKYTMIVGMHLHVSDCDAEPTPCAGPSDNPPHLSRATSILSRTSGDTEGVLEPYSHERYLQCGRLLMALAYRHDRRGLLMALAYRHDRRGSLMALAYRHDRRGSLMALAYRHDRRAIAY